MKWDKVKIPWYTHRLMHRKRVTSELHDNYFRLMTIKHAIPKIEWAIEWALNYHITQSRQEVRVRDRTELEKRCGRESPAEGALGALMSWGPEKLLIRCGRQSHSRPKGPWGPPVVSETRWWQDVVEKASPWASGWAALENEKDTTLTAIRVGVNILQFCSVSNSFSQ